MKIPANVNLAMLLLVVAGCVSAGGSKATFAGGDGSSTDSPVVVSGVHSHEDLQQAQHAWLADNLPGAVRVGGTYVIGPCACQAVEVQLATGSRRVVYFDIARMGR